MAEPVADATYAQGIEAARAALGSHRRRPRPVDPAPLDAQASDAPDAEVDARIAAVEAENRILRAALARIHDETRRTLDD